MNAECFIKGEGIYLLSHSVGLMPATTEKYFKDTYLSPWQQGQADTWTHWLSALHNFREAIAQLIHGEVLSVCPQANLSSALTKVLASLPKVQGKTKILLSAEDFPSMGYVIESMCGQDYQIEYIASDRNLQDLNQWESILTEDVAIAFLTHAQSNTGHCLPIKDITTLCQNKAIISIVDIAQSAGIVPIDVQQWQADCLIGSCVKWLCGGPGAGFLWLKPSLIDQCTPVDVGWFSHENPVEFDIFQFTYAQDALRFWGGTPSVAPFVMATNSINTLMAIGLDTIHQHNRRCKEQLLHNVPTSFVHAPCPPSQQSGTLVVKNSDALRQSLEQHNIQYDQRSTGIRLSPHIYTSETEIALVNHILRQASKACPP